MEVNMKNTNLLYAVVGALAVFSAILGYFYYQERREASGVEISIGKGGIAIEKK
jgi:RsiW-degrading membrane proteinase PrsW (M82 family)